MIEEPKKEEHKIAGDRLEKVKIWLKKPDNAILAGVLVLAIVIRLYFFFQTSGQTLWYDEADYMSTAKHWAFGIPYMLNVHRPPLFQLLGSFGFDFGLGEMWLKFLLVLLPSIILVYFVYLLGKEMYNEKVGLIAAFLIAVSWTLLFWSMRFQPDYLSMCLSVLAVLFMWKFWKGGKSKDIVWAGIFAALGFNFKVSGLLVPMGFIIFILIKDRLTAIFNKNYYYFSAAFLATLMPYFIWSYMQFGTPFSFTQGYSSAVEAASPFAWQVISFFYAMSENVIFVLFLLGFVLGLKFLLYADVIAKDKTKAFDPDLFSIIMLALTAAFYIFYIRGVEDRWVFLWLPFMFFLVGNALMFIYNFGKKYTKIISIIVVLLLLGIGGYMQLSHAKTLIDNKKESYSQVKDAALWIKDNSLKSDKILSQSYPQTTYYSERNIIIYSDINNSADFEALIAKEKPKYLEISIFEPHPEFVYKWPSMNNSIPVQVYYADKTNKQPVLIVYELNPGEQKTDNILDILNQKQEGNKTVESNATAELNNTVNNTVGGNSTL
jgi:predicted membrane protein